MEKQTAVEWLTEQFETIVFYSEEAKEDTIRQAKEMEKDQIMKAVYDSMGTNFDPNMGRAEQYYNENFKNK